MVILIGIEQFQLDKTEPRVTPLLLFVFGAQLDAARLARLDIDLAAVPCLVLQLQLEPVPTLFQLELLEQVLAVRNFVLVMNIVAQLQPAPLPVEVVNAPDLEPAVGLVAVVDRRAFLPLSLGHRVAVAGDVLVGVFALLQLVEGVAVPDALGVVIRLVVLLHMEVVLGVIKA